MDDLYDLYMATLLWARKALRSSDHEMRAVCAAVASRDGVESAVAMLALSDAEQGRPARRPPELRSSFRLRDPDEPSGS